MIRIDTLPPDHPLRNTPLGALEAQYQFIGNGAEAPRWRRPRKLAPGMPTTLVTYNDLRNGWVDYYEWYAP